jgi:hypothetical protein
MKIPACPKCRSRLIRQTISTFTGRYYSCDPCGNYWHHQSSDGKENRRAPRTSGPIAAGTAVDWNALIHSELKKPYRVH